MASGENAPQSEATTPAPGPGPHGEASTRVETVAPGASELGAQLSGLLRTTGVMHSLLVAASGAAVCAGVGLVLAVVTGEQSVLDRRGDGDLLTESLDQATGLVLPPFTFPGSGEESLRLSPLLYALVPLAGCAAFAFAMRSRTAPLEGRQRLAWGAAVGLPFALLMLLLAVFAGTGKDTVEPGLGAVFVLSLLWGGLGGLAGTVLALRRDVGAEWGQQALSGGAAPRATSIIGGLVRPFLVLLAIATLLGTATVVVQTFRDPGNTRELSDRSLATDLLDAVLYSGDHGVHAIELGVLAPFEKPEEFGAQGVPIPVTDSPELLRGPDDTYNLFDFSDAVPTWAFAGVLLLILPPVALTLYGGFALARRQAPNDPLVGAAWGALVGPAWGIAVAVLDGLLPPVPYGAAEGEGAFISLMIGGALLGGLGGFLAGGGPGAVSAASERRRQRASQAQATPPPNPPSG